MNNIGDVAQLVERLPCTHDVADSSSVISTILCHNSSEAEQLLHTEQVEISKFSCGTHFMRRMGNGYPTDCKSVLSQFDSDSALSPIFDI